MPNRIHYFLLPSLLVFAFIFSIKSGERGFFPFDQSIVFDGGYRIFAGQIPYKDFFIPFGPIVFWLQAMFFKLLGVNYFAYLFHAALMNIFATVVSLAILRLFFGSLSPSVYLGAAMTAIWFYPPFGTPWMEQTAHFFSFLAILGVLYVSFPKRVASRRLLLILFSAGLMAFIAFLSKQNIGLYMLPLYFMLIVITHWSRIRYILSGLVAFLVGIGTGFFLFAIWLITFSTPSAFVTHFLYIPSEIGLTRLKRNWPDIIEAQLLGTGPLYIRILFVLVFLIAVFVFIYEIRHFKSSSIHLRTNLLTSSIVIYLIFFQNLLHVTTRNEFENSLPYIGIIAVLGLLLAWRFIEISQVMFQKTVPAKSVTVFVVTLILIASVYGVQVSLGRKVHGVFGRNQPVSYMTAPGLTALRWMTTTVGGRITEDDVDALISYLRARKSRFFIFPEFTLLYGLLESPSPQPVLWFHRGLTYPHAYDSAIDQRIVNTLLEGQVEIVILQRESFADTQSILQDFPILKAYIQENYYQKNQIGEFLIFENNN
jgi:hypothetical protein